MFSTTIYCLLLARSAAITQTKITQKLTQPCGLGEFRFHLHGFFDIKTESWPMQLTNHKPLILLPLPQNAGIIGVGHYIFTL